jgi:hypothetical protein
MATVDGEADLASANRDQVCWHQIELDKHNIQVLFIYRFQPPFGLVQLAYQKGTARFGEKGAQGNTLFFKIAYMF